MGHEMGHYVMHHMWWGLALAILLIFFSLWFINKTVHGIIRRFRHRFKFDRLGDWASLPLLLLYASVLSFFLQPISNGVSRYMEHQSDVYGMEISGVSGDEAAVAFDKLSVFNLSDPDPNPIIEFWFYSHPSLKSRMNFVRSFRP
jgi:Zn-dependent protease with chaperone function